MPKKKLKPQRSFDEARLGDIVSVKEQEIASIANDLMNDAIEIMRMQISELKRKARNVAGGILPMQDINALQKITKALTEITKEAREYEKSKDYSDKTLDELIAIAETHKRRIAEKKDPKVNVTKRSKALNDE